MNSLCLQTNPAGNVDEGMAPGMVHGLAEEATQGAPARGAQALRIVALDIKLSHTVFAMPFAVLGAFLARPEGSAWSRFGLQMLLVVVCMVAARTFAMVVNRMADRRIDAGNPRTARRAFASGVLRPSVGWATLAGCAALFFGGAAGFWWFFGNTWPVVLAGPVLAYLGLYSFTKRFTWLCHLYLGVALSISPIAAVIAVNPPMLYASTTVFWIAGMVASWVAGFDIIYALQDVEVDRAAGLWSIPSRLGVGPAIWISRCLHAAALGCLTVAWRSDARLGWAFGAAVMLVGALLVTEHLVLARRGKAGLEMAFFTINGVVSCVLGVVGCIDLTV